MLLGSKGYPVSFECSELIAELKMDIREFGKNKLLAVWLKEYSEHGVEFVTNYDFIVDEEPISEKELDKNERIALMTAERLLDLLEKQNNPIEVYNLDDE